MTHNPSSGEPLDCVIVSHTHWDREWYRSYQTFRAHLVDVVDALLELLDHDPGYRFALDGQSIIIEDYLEIRPDAGPALAAACASGRLSVGPWYTQPDSFIPSGESHVRNLLEGRRVGEQIAPAASRVAYVPDSFGHPAQFPQLLAGFGLDGFLYWRGDTNESLAAGPVWRWRSPDGSEVTAVRLAGGYSGGGNPGRDVDAAVERLVRCAPDAPGLGGHVLLMNGGDHQPADPTIGSVAEKLAAETGWTVRRGLFEDFLATLPSPSGPAWEGELCGAAHANLLPGGWSTWMPVKLANRAAETALVGWAEPFAVLASQAGLADEQPSLHRAWRALLANQAHDSLVGSSADGVMKQVVARLDDVGDLVDNTVSRLLERLAGAPVDRRVPLSERQDLAVFNPSPHARTDVVRFPIDAFPLYGQHAEGIDPHPLALAGLLYQGFTVDGEPVRVVVSDDVDRVGLLSSVPPVDLEFVVRNVPALGWRRLTLEPADATPDAVDAGTAITNGLVEVDMAPDGTFSVSVQASGQALSGLGAVVDEGDRGDLYDWWPVEGDDPGARLVECAVERRVHPSGISELVVRRTFEVPAGLDDQRAHRSEATVTLPLDLTLRLVPGVARVDVDVAFENTAGDHRLGLRFPTGDTSGTCTATTTFDIVERSSTRPDDEHWKQPAPATFPGQGWVHAGGLTVVAPGHTELAFDADGVVGVTLLRSVQWLSREDHALRPENAGPGQHAPAALGLGEHRARLALVPGLDPRAAVDAEVGLRAVVAGEAPALAEGVANLTLDPPSLLLSTCKPADDGDGVIVRVLNPTSDPETARLAFAAAVEGAEPVRLDETPVEGDLDVDGRSIRFDVAPHALRTIRVRLSPA